MTQFSSFKHGPRVTGLCAYCLERRAVNADHVVPKSYRHRLTIPDEFKVTVPCCLQCNVNKGTRKLVPRSWKDKIPALKEAMPGEWRTWDGNPRSESFSGTHK